jgi:uncharacterized membrane protein YeaQ/YmgE (transglycosylase-associated protein family)
VPGGGFTAPPHIEDPERFNAADRDFLCVAPTAATHRGAVGLTGLDDTSTEYALDMLILGIILFGMLIGAAAQLIVGRSAKGVDWGLALAAGLVGSFIGGLVVSLISGDGVVLRPSGIIGSLAGAIIVTFAWHWWRRLGAASRR